MFKKKIHYRLDQGCLIAKAMLEDRALGQWFSTRGASDKS